MDSTLRQRDLLFGLLAVQSGLLKPPSLVAALSACREGGDRPLADVLVQQGALRPDERTLVESLAKVQAARQARDPTGEQASLSLAPELHDELFRLADADLRQVLEKMAPRPAVVPRPARSEKPGSLDATLPDPALQGQRSDAAGAAAPADSAATRFRIVRPHARGGLGEVYVALDRELHREVALKEIQSRHAKTADTRTRFLVEAEITGGLEHPGIVPVYGLGTYPDGRPFYAMRLIRGESLKQAIERFYSQAATLAPGQRRFELRQLLGRFVDVCEAIEYAHSRGILHRDIKPGNIMLGKYGETLVVDWGLAKALDRPDAPNAAGERQLVPLSASGTQGTQLGAALGTPQFMSPEQARGELDNLGPATDVYSLGATLYNLIVGRPAVVDADVAHLVERVKVGDFPPPRAVRRDVPRPLEAICLKAMALRPADRYPSAQALADDVNRYLADEPVAAYREPLRQRTLRWLRRHKAWAQAIAAALVLVAVVAVAAGVRIDQARRAEAFARADAEDSLAAARRTVEEFFTQVSESHLLDVPGLQPLRKELLEKARDYYQEFIARHAADPALAADLALAHYRVALVEHQVGAKAEALSSLERALALQDRLSERQPDDRALALARSDTLNMQGSVLLDLGRTEDALAAFRRALEVRSNLVAEVPAEPGYRRKLANSHANVSAALARLNRFAAAAAESTAANRARAALAATRPDELRLLRDLAQGQYNLALLHRQAGELPAALASADEAAATYRQLVERDRRPIDYRRELALAERAAGEVVAELHPAAQALARLHAARQTAEQLARENPFLVELRADVAAIYTSLGRTEQRVSGAAAAAEWFAQALAVRQRLVEEDPQAARFRQDLAGNWLQLGTTQLAGDQFDEAGHSFAAGLALLEQLAAEQPDDVEIQDAIGQAHTDLGLVHRLPGDSPGAAEWFTKALAVYERMAQQHPERVEGELGRADSLLNLAVEARTQGRPEEAAQRLVAAIETQQRLVERYPAAVKYREVLGEMLYLDAVLAAGRGDLAAAAARYKEARDLRQQMVDEQPANLGNRSSLGVVLDELSLVQWKQGRREEARATSRAAAEHVQAAFDQSPEVVQYRRNLSNHLANAAVLARQSGDWAGAAELVARRSELWPGAPDELYKSAVAYVLIADWQLESSAPPRAGDPTREELLARAVAALQAAIAAGWHDWDSLASDPRLATLREEPAVRALLNERGRNPQE